MRPTDHFPSEPQPCQMPCTDGFSASTVGSPSQSPAVPCSSTTLDTQRQEGRLTLFIDRLAKTMKLSRQQIQELHGLHQIALSFDSLHEGDVAMRLYSVACQYASECRILYAIQTSLSDYSNDSPLTMTDLTMFFRELKTLVNGSFKITANQRAMIRKVGQELIFRSSRTSFMGLHTEIDRKMRASPKEYDMDYIYGQMSRETVLCAAVKSIASSVRNVFRQDIRKSLSGSKAMTLNEFTVYCNKRHHSPSLSGGALAAQTIYIALLRRFAYENQDILAIAEPDSHAAEEDGYDVDDRPEAINENGKRPNGNIGHARIRKGQDFWTMVDSWFEEQIDVRGGTDYSSASWKSYIEETIQLDDSRQKRKQRRRLGTALENRMAERHSQPSPSPSPANLTSSSLNCFPTSSLHTELENGSSMPYSSSTHTLLGPSAELVRNMFGPMA